VLFVWSATLGKILTMDNLRKWDVIVVDWCCMYKKSVESLDLLLLHCKMASALSCLMWDIWRVGHLEGKKLSMFLRPGTDSGGAKEFFLQDSLSMDNCLWLKYFIAFMFFLSFFLLFS